MTTNLIDCISAARRAQRMTMPRHRGLASLSRLAAALCGIVIAAWLLAPLAHAQSVVNPPVGQVSSDGTVYAVARQADGRVVIGGSFTLVNGTPRSNIARFNADGTLDATWAPNADNIVYALAIDASGAVYAGGIFSQIGGASRTHLAKLAATGTGAADPTWSPDVLGFVYALALNGSGSVYVGGYFLQIGGVLHRHVARLSTSGSGAVDTAWNPDPNDDVRAIALDAMGNVYAGGHFTSIGSAPRRYIARLDGGNGAADAVWAPNADHPVAAIALDGLGNVFAGGEFASIGGAPRARIAKLLAAGGGVAVPGWAPSVDGAVATLGLNGSDLYVGGGFANIGGLARANIARLDAWSGAADPGWIPNANRAVRALVVDPLANVYAGGLATTTAPSVGFASVDLDGATVAGWSKTLVKAGSVYALARDAANRTIIGGAFQYMGDGSPRRNIARLNADGSLDAQWMPDADGGVYAVAIDGAGSVYAGGKFGSIGGQSNRNLAKLAGSGNGSADPLWAPRPDAEVFALALDGAGGLFAGGQFDTIGGLARANIAKLATSGAGTVDALWAPDSTGPIYALVTDRGGNVFAAGLFSHIGGQDRFGVAKLSASGAGAADPVWSANADDTVIALALDGNGNLFAGGLFTHMGGQPRKHIAKLAATGTGAVDASWAPAPNGDVLAVATDGVSVYAGGVFTGIGAQQTGRLARLAAGGTGAVDAGWSPAVDGEVDALLLGATGDVFVGGGFTAIAGQTRLGYGQLTAK